MKEKDFQSAFGKWLVENPPLTSTAFELKLAKGPLPFAAVKPHQTVGLQIVKHKGLYHKISDAPIFPGNKTRFTKPKPFDCLYLKEIEAYVVVLFYVPKAKKLAVFIDIDVWVNEVETSKRKSLTPNRARQISSKIEQL